MKIEVAMEGKDGVAQTREATSFRSMARYEGVSPDALGFVVTLNREAFRLHGMPARSGGKYAFLAERVSDGKIYKFTAESVRGALAEADAAANGVTERSALIAARLKGQAWERFSKEALADDAVLYGAAAAAAAKAKPAAKPGRATA